jgi:hypothetical protein
MRRILLTVLAALALAGCATHPRYVHYDDGADYYYGANVDYVPDYISYGAYYDALWPVYHHYYDPFYAPGFRYGVTWFPTNWYGFGGGRYPYWSYSPWRYSWYDGYYDWAYWHRHRPYRNDWQRFGSRRAESAAIASMRRDAAPITGRRDVGPITGRRDAGPITGRRDAGPITGRRDAGPAALRGGYPDRRDTAPVRGGFAGERDVGGASLRNNRRDIEGQVPTRGVAAPDRYYGEPRVHRGEGPRREAFVERSYERGNASRLPIVRDGAAPGRSGGRYDDRIEPRRDVIGGQDRAWRTPTPPQRDGSFRSSDRGGYPMRSDRGDAPAFRAAPADRGGVPMMRSAPSDRGGGAPMMRSAPVDRGGSAPMRSAPPARAMPSAPAMRSAPSAPARSVAPSRSGGDRDR